MNNFILSATLTTSTPRDPYDDEEVISADTLYFIIGATSGVLILVILVILCHVWCRRRHDEVSI